MITYFSEIDLVSFGNFLLSPTRREIYIEQGITADKVDGILLTVNPADIKNWLNIVVKERQLAAQKAVEDKDPQQTIEFNK